MTSWIVLLSLFFSLTVQARSLRGVSQVVPPSPNMMKTLSQEQCETVDLSKDSRFPPIRDQGQHGYCTAYAMADVIGFREGVHISALDLAYQTRHRERRGDPAFNGMQYSDQGGIDTDQVSHFVNQRGYCPESRARSTYSDKEHPEISSAIRNIGSEAIQLAILPRAIPKDIRNDNSLRVQISESCGVRRRLKAPVSFDIMLPTRHSAVQMFSSLDRREPSLVTVENSKLSGEKGLHMMVIVGRKWNGSSCDISLRNSWGKSCGGYARAGFKCSDGVVTIPAKELIPAVLEIGILANVKSIQPHLMGAANRGGRD